MKLLSKETILSIGLSILIVTPLAVYLACAGNVEAVSEFDHSQCQYPYRTTNPADGCDNTDPCDPLKTKGGGGDCEPETKPVVTIPVAPIPETNVTPIVDKPKTCVEWR